jgi:hypothetical protein
MTNTMSARMIVLAFVAGVLATLIPHQLVLLALGVPAYSRAPTQPFGIWEFVSLSFFGGLWGIVIALIVQRLRPPMNDWLGWLILGAILPSLVFFVVVTPLKYPPALIYKVQLFIVVPIVNAIWGIATWAIIKAGNMAMGRVSTA